MAQESDKESPIVTYDDLCHYLITSIIAEERRKIMTYFRVARSFTLSDDIMDDNLFILKLEQYEIISDSNVDRLLECLEFLKMRKLAERIQSFKLTTETEQNSSMEHEKVPTEGIDVCKVHQNQLEIMCDTCEKKICYACGFTSHRSEDHLLYFLMASDSDSKGENENKETDEVNLCKKHNKKLVITCNTCNNIMCYMCAFHDHRGEDHVLNFPGDTNHCIEHQWPLTAFCKSCNEIICNVCVFRSHRGTKDHVIFSGSEVDENVDETVKLLLRNVAILDDTVESMQPSVIACTNPSSSEVTQDPLNTQFDIWAKQAADEMSNVGKELKLHKAKKDDDTELLLKYIGRVNTDLERLKRNLREVKNKKSKGTLLKKLKEWEMFITSSKKKLIEKKQALQSYCCLRTSFRSLPLDNGRFGKFHSSSVIGAVCVSKHLSVVVRDKRHVGGTVSLSCISSEHGKLLWEHHVYDIKQTHPVVMAGSLYACKLKHRLLIGCGRKIFSFTVEDENEDLKIEKIESKSVAILDNRYIISMNTITNELGVGDVGVMILINASKQLLRLNEDLDIIDRFDCSELVNSIACLACVGRDVALVDSVRNEIVLVNTGKVVSLSGKLEPPSNLPNSCRPKVIQWDGSLWGVIWESIVDQREAGPTWQHSVYPRNARKSHSGTSDTCPLNTEIVSISFMGNQTLVCLSDGKVNLFGTNDAVSELSDLVNLTDLSHLPNILQMLQTR